VIIGDHSEYSIPEIIYEWILPRYRDCPGIGCPSYYASDTHYVDVELAQVEELIIGGHIMDCDVWSADDRLFDGALSIRASDLVPGEDLIGDRSIILFVQIEELESP